jgi:hypothetical protein
MGLNAKLNVQDQMSCENEPFQLQLQMLQRLLKLQLQETAQNQ